MYHFLRSFKTDRLTLLTRQDNDRTSVLKKTMKDQGAHQDVNCSVRYLHWRKPPHLCSERAVAITKRRGINIVAPHSNVCNARLSQMSERDGLHARATREVNV